MRLKARSPNVWFMHPEHNQCCCAGELQRLSATMQTFAACILCIIFQKSKIVECRV